MKRGTLDGSKCTLQEKRALPPTALSFNDFSETKGDMLESENAADSDEETGSQSLCDKGFLAILTLRRFRQSNKRLRGTISSPNRSGVRLQKKRRGRGICTTTTGGAWSQRSRRAGEGCAGDDINLTSQHGGGECSSGAACGSSSSIKVVWKG